VQKELSEILDTLNLTDVFNQTTEHIGRKSLSDSDCCSNNRSDVGVTSCRRGVSCKGSKSSGAALAYKNKGRGRVQCNLKKREQKEILLMVDG
jgi:hypothetical protein